MSKERILNLLILGELALAVASIICDWLLEPLLSYKIQAGLAEGSALAARKSTPLLTGLWVAVVVSTLLAWTGLLNLWKVARPLYVGSWAAYLAWIILSGPAVSLPLVRVLNTLMAIVGGMIVSLVYFSDLGPRFRRLPRSLQEPTGPAAGTASGAS